MSKVIVMTEDELKALIKATWEESRAAEHAKEVLTRDEAAQLLNVHPKVLTKYIADGLPAHKIGPEYRFRRSEILRWLDSRKVA